MPLMHLLYTIMEFTLHDNGDRSFSQLCNPRQRCKIWFARWALYSNHAGISWHTIDGLDKSRAIRPGRLLRKQRMRWERPPVCRGRHLSVETSSLYSTWCNAHYCVLKSAASGRSLAHAVSRCFNSFQASNTACHFPTCFRQCFYYTSIAWTCHRSWLNL